MFTVEINETRYEYDVNALVKAFFPTEDVKVLTPDTGAEKRAELLSHKRMEIIFSEDGAELCFCAPFSEGETMEYSFQMRSAEQKNNGESEAGTLKAQIKKFLYQALSNHTGKSLPWGNLTGIRPTKIAMGMLEKGSGETEILSFLRDEHFVSDEKASLSLEIAKREKRLLSTLHFRDGYSLYIGIPFCPTTCLYCSFTSYPICRYGKLADTYLDCLIREMRETALLMEGKALDSIYIGGGTPSTLEAEQLDRLITALEEIFDLSGLQEFTVECGRADSISQDKLTTLARHKVGRISINPQTMKEETLRIIGRQHTVEQVKEAFCMAREAGSFCINMDMILGLPGETAEDVRRSVSQIEDLAPDSLTVHSLAVKRASKMGEWIARNGVPDGTRDGALMENAMKIAAEGAKRMGMHPYYLYRQKNMSGNLENVGYATEGNYGIYNILIMEEVQSIVALGAGSISKRVYKGGRIERCENVKDVELYIRQIDEMIERKRVLFRL